jgi:hypothetical protein
MHLLVPAALLCLVPLVRAQEVDPADPVAHVDAVLVRLDEHGDRALAAQELSELGPAALPAVFDAFVGERGVRVLALLDAIILAPKAPLNAAITAALQAAPPPGPDVALQRAALKAMEVAGTVRDFDLCLLAAKVLGEETFAPRTGELTAALDAIFARDPALIQVVQRSWLSIERRLRTPVARAVGNLGGDAALLFLAGLLERDDANAGMLLSQLGRASRGVSRETADDVADLARKYLNSDTPGIVKETAVLLARLGDDAAVPDLIPLLGEESRGLTGNAYWALKEITGLTLPKDETVWEAWHSREREWWTRDSRQAFRAVANRDPAVAVAGVREVASHRLARHALALEIAPALRHDAPSVRSEAADALKRLGSNAVVYALQDALADPNANVRSRVRAALVALGGEVPAEIEVAGAR